MMPPPDDPGNDCAMPAVPAAPVSDRDAALFILDQAAAIEKCRARLGKTDRKNWF